VKFVEIADLASDENVAPKPVRNRPGDLGRGLAFDAAVAIGVVLRQIDRGSMPRTIAPEPGLVIEDQPDSDFTATVSRPSPAALPVGALAQ
jgi:hypothetical protein